MPGLRHLVAATTIGLALSGSPAAADADPRSELVRLYTLSVAIDVCGDLGITDGDEDRLDKATSLVEARLALTEEASEALYSRLSASADNDKEAFCKEVGPTVKDAIGKLPE